MTSHDKSYEQEEFKGPKNRLATLMQQMVENMPAIREDIEEIITLKDKNGARIEQTLDTLLDYMEMGVGEREFIRLNEYYQEVDKEAYEFYRKEYEKYLEDNE